MLMHDTQEQSLPVDSVVNGIVDIIRLGCAIGNVQQYHYTLC